MDLVSGGELYRALKAGVDPSRMVYSGVGKREDEIDLALRTGILMFNVESFQELETINVRAGKLGVRAGIGLRVNPDVDPETHAHISTGLKGNKFGINVEASLLAYRYAAKLKHVDIKGVSCHIGSQVTKTSPFIDALGRLKDLIRRLREEGIAIHYLDLGGGLGITYDRETPPHPSEYARAIIDASSEMDCTFIFEPGRVIVGNAGILVTRVLYTKENDGKRFVIVDAGMNDLVRPSLYGSFHLIQPVIQRERGGDHDGCGRPDLRIGRFSGEGATDARCREGGASGGDERRRLWFQHVVQLQFASPDSGDPGPRRPLVRNPETGEL